MDTIRMATEADAEALAAIYAPSITDAPTSFEVVAPNSTQMAQRVTAVLVSAPWLVLERHGAVAGYTYAARHKERAAYQWAVDVSIFVRPEHQRSGVGRALYTVLFELLRVQGFFVAHAGITLPNPASVRLHESVGFTSVGVYPAVGYKLGAWHDVGWWRLALRAPEHPAAPPLVPADAARDPNWQAALGSVSDHRSMP